MKSSERDLAATSEQTLLIEDKTISAKSVSLGFGLETKKSVGNCRGKRVVIPFPNFLG